MALRSGYCKYSGIFFLKSGYLTLPLVSVNQEQPTGPLHLLLLAPGCQMSRQVRRIRDCVLHQHLMIKCPCNLSIGSEIGKQSTVSSFPGFIFNKLAFNSEEVFHKRTGFYPTFLQLQIHTQFESFTCKFAHVIFF